MFTKERVKYPYSETLNMVKVESIAFVEILTRSINICLRKSEVGLGFIVGYADTGRANESNIYVKKIMEFGPAKIDGRLRVGDRISKINNHDVVSMYQTDFVKLLRSLPKGEIIILTISRTILKDEEEDDLISTSETPNKYGQFKISLSESKSKNFHFIITTTSNSDKDFHCQSSTGVLGISVEYVAREVSTSSAAHQTMNLCNEARIQKSENIQRQFFVKTILKDGSAYQDRRLKIGDEILAVQGIDVQNGGTYIIDPDFDIYGDIFHFDLAAVFIKKLEKLNKLSEFKLMFDIHSKHPLAALKCLITEAGEMYSSISIVVRRTALLNEMNITGHKRGKKTANELHRIENIFGLNPDFRYDYGSYRAGMQVFKKEQFGDICRQTCQYPLKLDEYSEQSHYKARTTPSDDENNCFNKELCTYLSKSYDYSDNENHESCNDRSDPDEDCVCEFVEDLGGNIVEMCLHKE